MTRNHIPRHHVAQRADAFVKGLTADQRQQLHWLLDAAPVPLRHALLLTAPRLMVVADPLMQEYASGPLAELYDACLLSLGEAPQPTADWKRPVKPQKEKTP